MKILFTLWILLLMPLLYELTAQDKLEKFVIGSGGTIISNTALKGGVTVGQPLIGVVSGGQQVTHVGFWNTLAEFITAVEEIDPKFLSGYDLTQNFPNPFRQETTIEFEIPKRVHVRINLYDDRGRILSVLADEEFTQGRYRIRFDRKSLGPGLYFYRMETAEYGNTRKCIIL